MIADISPIGRIGPDSLPKENPPKLKLQPDRRNDKLGMFFSNLSWTDRQILALHFAEKLSPWEIHVVMNLSMSDVLCKIQHLKKIARQSMAAGRRGSPPKLSLK